MKVRKIQLQFEEYTEGEQLPAEDIVVMNEAKQAVETSYSPYSEFCVGAALLLEDGTVVRGSNQENASYPLGLCAERVAIFYANAQYPGLKIVSLAITASARNFITKSPITPCGACRQVIAESENRQGHPIRILMQGQEGITQIINGVETLLPLSFKGDKLKKRK